MIFLNKIATTSLVCVAAATAFAAAQPPPNNLADISGDFCPPKFFYYLADKVSEFDPATHAGRIFCQRAQYRVRLDARGGNASVPAK